MDYPENQKNKKPHALFCIQFVNHISSFMKTHNLVNKNKKITLSVSGGVDSLALVSVFHKLQMDLEIIHFNHGTRPSENLLEEEHLRELATTLNIPLKVFHLNLSLSEKNFEKTARQKRQQVYKEYIQKGHWIYTAHHIDDSFEWSLMQSFKQSSLEAALGIPLFANGVVRPFMCVTKKHILRYARAARVKWLEDSSNNNQKFERNFLRHNITNVLLKKYPQALSHYVSRSNAAVLRKSSDIKITRSSDFILVESPKLSDHRNDIKKLLFTLSKKDRGEIDGELSKLFKAQDLMLEDSKSFPFKGPMNFSGGVTIYLIKNQLLMMNKKRVLFYQEFDQKLKSHLMKMAQIPTALKISEFPNLVVSMNKKLSKSSKYIHPLLPVTCLWLKNQNISYSFDQIIGVSDRQMLAYDALILDSSIIG